MEDSNNEESKATGELFPVNSEGLQGVQIRLQNLENMQSCVSKDLIQENLKLSRAINAMQSNVEKKSNILMAKMDEVQLENRTEQLKLTTKLWKMISEL